MFVIKLSILKIIIYILYYDLMLCWYDNTSSIKSIIHVFYQDKTKQTYTLRIHSP